MTEIIAIIGGTLIVFMVIVLPIWLLLHYITKVKTARGLDQEDQGMLSELWETANRMERRIESLETILDEEIPNWRRKL